MRPAASAIAEETAPRAHDRRARRRADLEVGWPTAGPRTARRDERLCRRYRTVRWSGRVRWPDPRRALGRRILPFAADRGAVDRIANLIANGLAHAPRPGGHVSVEAAGLPDGELLLAVRDDGPGIQPAALVHVFERFYRADPSRSGPGSGLGLAIVEQLAEAHGGRAFADNLAGGGARVGVVLPDSPPPPEDPSMPEPSS
jgi:signal transduction histidine kinase